MAYENTIIVLVPNEEYRSSVPEPHLTVCDFGKTKDLEPYQKAIIFGLASDIAEMHPYYERPPKVSGRGVFQIDPRFSDGHSMAYVDLIDQNILPAIRRLVEQRAGFVNRGHGFTPHITVAYGTAWMPDLAKPSGLYAFKWASCDVWMSGERTSFQISLDRPKVEE